VVIASESAVQTVAIVLGSAVAIAVFAGDQYRRYRSRRRVDFRNRDRTYGWSDDRDQYHPGAVDLVMGWKDEGGDHLGLDTRVTTLERRPGNNGSSGGTVP
jgi:hypothetical protein